jgi:serine/threonine-protein kinase HipA
MSEAQVDEINVLKLSLHERLVGYLAGFKGGRNVLSFAGEFKSVVIQTKSDTLS